MKRITIPVCLFVVLLVSGCELSRSGDPGNIAPDVPVVTGPDTTVPPLAATEEVPPPGGAGPVPGEVESDGVPAAQAPDPNAFEEGKVLLKLEPQASIQARGAQPDANGIMSAGVPGLDERLAQIGATGLEPVIEDVASALGQDIGAFANQTAVVGQLFSVEFPPENNNPVEVAGFLSEDSTVEYAEPNYLVGMAGAPRAAPPPLTPNDPYFNLQWNFQTVQMPAAWDRATGANVTVAIIDTGIDFGAPDLANANRLQGYDFVNDDSDPTDDQGHGTHVAGTVAQRTNNGLGVAGVAFDARLLPVKVLNATGQGSFESIVQGITYAVGQGADVINMSLASRQSSRSMEDAVRFAHDRGVVVVVAAGNSGSSVEYPAAYDHSVIAVGATRFDNTRAHYSNFGPQIDLVAPGGDISVDQNNDSWADGVLQQTFSSSGSGYSFRFFEGTSMASPHVAGAAALLLSRKPEASPDEIKAILMQTALTGLGPAEQFGAGLLQVAQALEAIDGVSSGPTATFTPTPTTPAQPDTPTPTPTEGPIDEHDGDIPTTTFTPTPTISPTPSEPGPITPSPVVPGPTTPTPPPAAGELLTNGGFESDDGWIFGDTPIRGQIDSVSVHSGSGAARLGADLGPDLFSYSSVWQRVTIPAEANQVTLNAYVFPVSQDKPGTDAQIIMILDETFWPLKTLSRELSDSQTWEQQTYDLADLRGRTIYVYFSVFNRGRTGRLSAMFVDDVSLTWSP